MHEYSLFQMDATLPVGMYLDHVSYQLGHHKILHQVTCAFKPKQLNAIVGPNGAGKSSLMKLMVGLDKPTSGAVRVLNNERIAYFSQECYCDMTFPITVKDVVLMGAFHEAGGFKPYTSYQQAHASKILRMLGLEGKEDKLLNELSVGQRQLVKFARTCMQDADIILLDEPFHALDANAARRMLVLLKHYQGQGKTIIAILHDLMLAKEHFAYTLLLSQEVIAWGKTRSVLTDKYLGTVMPGASMAQTREQGSVA